MARSVGSVTTGHKKLMKQLQSLGKAGRSGNRRAVRKAVNVLRKAAKDECPVDDGTLRAAQIAVVKVRRDFVSGQVGADGTAKGPNGEEPFRYDHLVHDGFQMEDGTTVPGNPYLQRAFDNSIEEAQATYVREAKAAIERIAKGG